MRWKWNNPPFLLLPTSSSKTKGITQQKENSLLCFLWIAAVPREPLSLSLPSFRKGLITPSDEQSGFAIPGAPVKVRKKPLLLQVRVQIKTFCKVAKTWTCLCFFAWAMGLHFGWDTLCESGSIRRALNGNGGGRGGRGGGRGRGGGGGGGRVGGRESSNFLFLLLCVWDKKKRGGGRRFALCIQKTLQQ